MVIRRLLLLALAGPLAASLTAGQRPDPNDSAQAFGTDITAVVVDVIVRDRRGNPVIDLRENDFELFEDGVRQRIGDVTLVAPARGARPTSPRAGPASATPAPVSDAEARTTVEAPTFVALVFDRLSPEARALALQGALAYLDVTTDTDFAGVFVSDSSLRTVQTYTNDPAQVRQALHTVAASPATVFDRDATHNPLEQMRVNDMGISGGDASTAVPVVASAESPGRPFTTSSSALQRRLSADEVVAMALQTSRLTFEALARDQQGHATTNALLAVVNGLGRLPGRKTVVFFAEALALPDTVLPHFQHVVGVANRGNVSIYTVDAAGLRVHSGDAATARDVRAMGEKGLSVGPDGSNQSTTAMLERNEDVLRKDPRTSLTLLAQQTGGFLIEGTNDLARRFRDIDADRRFHYLLTYTPTNDRFNGEWRNVAVRVPGRRVEVRARSGYQALRTPSVIPVLAWEVSALQALALPSPPRDIAIRTGLFTFPAVGGESVVPMAVSVEAQRLAFDVRPDGFRTDFTILTRVVDAAGEVVRKGSQPYRLAGPPDRLEATRAGEVLFYRQPTLPPGDYTLEVAVVDAFARRGTVERRPFTVPAAGDNALRVSSLVVVKGAERVRPEEQEAGHPLHVRDLLVYPNLGEPLAQGEAMTLLATIVPGAGGSPAAELEIWRGDERIAARPVPLDAPDESGRIQQLVQIPPASLEPGEYLLRLIVEHGAAPVVREARLRVQ